MLACGYMEKIAKNSLKDVKSSDLPFIRLQDFKGFTSFVFLGGAGIYFFSSSFSQLCYLQLNTAGELLCLFYN